MKRRGTINKVEKYSDLEGNSEDEFHKSRDKVLLDYEEENSLGQSKNMSDEEEEEVFKVDYDTSEESEAEGEYSDEDSESEDTDDGEDGEEEEEEDSEEEEEGSEEDGDSWGKRKKVYYNADEVLDSSNEDEMNEEEEKEALRIQRQQYLRLRQEDFGDLTQRIKVKENEDEDENSKRSRMITQIQDIQNLMDIDELEQKSDSEEIKKLSKEEKKKLLTKKHKEVLVMVKDIKKSMTKIRDLEEKLEKKSNTEILGVIYQLELTKISCLGFYLMAKSSEKARLEGLGELKEHAVVPVIMKLQEQLDSLYKIHERSKLINGREWDSEDESDVSDKNNEESDAIDYRYSDSENGLEISDKENVGGRKKKTSKDKKRRGRIEEKSRSVDNDAMEYYNLKRDLVGSKPAGKRRSAVNRNEATEMIGEFKYMDQDDYEDKEKAFRQKSLRNHASKLINSSNKKDKRLTLSGDIDIPYKKHAKNIAVVEDDGQQFGNFDEEPPVAKGKHGRSGDSAGGDDLSGDDEYYNQIKHQSKKLKDQKQHRKLQNKSDAWKTVLEDNVEREKLDSVDVSYDAASGAISQSNKRGINFYILKNKGLTPKRSKEQRNPRVKRRVRYENAKKKMHSNRIHDSATRNHYAGERTGINDSLSKSVKFS
ncbi:hypothetical protein AX774_g6665 [Zancudomyces culisetae]|uniref:Sas10 C-terminal domain-containing protein n=1 Tax=Zancudomyces culisetae TaxID=1213189 RepID=A0A1R1PG18_ZANCU|nr:hypothetical protein AX774_g6665 [Zancudomyces culisetae]|eukprot:OMH79911.1 hypothetical protein AX774_g6665 [Zancudomyces culisetae]